jgi:hypothetical protein
MDARSFRAWVLAAVLVSWGAGHRTTNFAVQAPTEELARTIAEAAEKYRRELAIEWLGSEMRPWFQPCPITARVRPDLGAGGATSFLFDRGEVYGWRMTIQGSQERILDSVLPHEVMHTIFASHFRQALPRWADEGACTTVEHTSERAKQQKLLIKFLKTGKGIAFSQMFAMKDYPSDVLPLYSQGYSLASYLIGQGGKQKFLEFVATGLQDENWPRAVREHYGQQNLLALQNEWLDWVRNGSPAIPAPSSAAPQATLVAQDQRRLRPAPNLIYRAQSADPPHAVPGKLIAAQQANLSDVRVGESSAPDALASPPAAPQPRVLLEWSRPTSRDEPSPTGSQAIYDASRTRDTIRR